jgi:hypothetical protein
MKKSIAFILISLLFATTPSNTYSQDTIIACDVSDQEIAYLLYQIKIDNKPPIRAMDDCKKANHHLFAQIIGANPDYFQFASDSLKDDEVFISKFVAINPQILKYISERLSNDEFFIFKMAKIYPEALQYASPQLIDNKKFIKKMIGINPKNFIYGSTRLQNDEEIVVSAVRSNGKMLKFASDQIQDDKKVVIEAVKSYSLAAKFASERLQKDREVKKMAKKIDYSFLENFDQFLKENYGGLVVGTNGARGYHIVNMAKSFPEKQIIYQPYVTKWERVYENGVETNDLKLTAQSTQIIGWKDVFKDYPQLIKAVENIFIANRIDANTIDALNVVSFWEVSKTPKVVVFDLYLLRQIDNKYLSADVSNVVSLSAIAKEKKNKKWEINVVESTLDADLKMSVSYRNGHKRYRVWDIYQINNKDKNPKILFKVEDKDGEYFDLFTKQINDRYASVYKGGGYAMEINLFD